MPIKGLTDNGMAGFPVLGKLRKGEKKTREDRPGKDLPDYFRFTSDMSGVPEAFQAAYDPEPNEFTFFFAYPDMSRNWDTCKERWLGGEVLHHRCDGEMCSRWIDEKTGEYLSAGQDGVESIPCPGECKETGRLEIVLMPLVEAGYVGTVTMETHSINDIVAIGGALRAGELLLTQWGWRISQVPWFLYRTTKRVGRPRTAAEKKKLKSLRTTTDKSLVFVAPDSEWMAAQVKALQEASRLQLSAPDLETAQPNERMAREAPLPAPRAGDDEPLLKTEEPPAPASLPEGLDIEEGQFEEKQELDLRTKDAFWSWAREQFPDMTSEQLGDACRTATSKSADYNEAAKLLLKELP